MNVPVQRTKVADQGEATSAERLVLETPAAARDGNTAHHSLARRWLVPVAVAGAYTALGNLVHRLSPFPDDGPAMLWLPSGLGIAAVLLLGYRVWPAIFLGEWVLHRFVLGEPSALAVALASGTALTATTVRRLVHREGRPADFFASGGNFATLVSSLSIANGFGILMTAAALLASGKLYSPWLTSLPKWWLANLSGALISLPLVVALRRPDWRNMPRPCRRNYALLLSGTIVLETVLFDRQLPALFLLPPLLLWSAVRYGSVATTVFGALTTGVAIWQTAQGDGELARLPPATAGMVLQIFAAVSMITALLALAHHRALRKNYRKLRRHIARVQNRLSESRLDLGRQDAHLARCQALARLGSWERDPITGTERWSEEAKRLLGLPTTAEARFELSLEYVHPEDRAKVLAAQRALSEPGGRVDLEYRIVLADGAIRHLHERAAVAHDSPERTSMATGALLDVTDWKHTEAMLLQARTRAESAHRAKSEFLASMSREIRTPLNGIQSAADLLLNGPLTPDQQEYAEIIRRGGENLSIILGDILDLSTIEAGRLQLEGVDFDLHENLATLTRQFGLKARGRELELICDFPPDLPARVRGDPARLRQVLSTLLDNAVQFTERGEIRLGAGVESETERNVTLYFQVSDSGIGIAPERLPTLFDAFAEWHGGSRRNFGTTGLALAIAKVLVELMQGRISVVSDPGRGSEFRFTAVFDKQPLEAHPPDLAGTLSARRVLVVGTSPRQTEILSRWLAVWGCQRSYTSTLAAAVPELESAARQGEPFGVAILDLPDAEVERFLQATDAAPAKSLPNTTTWLALTGYATDPRRLNLQTTGIAAWLTKPITPSKLYDALASLLTAPVSGLAIPPSSSSETGRSPTPWRILLAEDNPANQQAALAILHRLGYAADVVSNGAACLAALSDKHYDLVLMDCQMPELDGYSATRRIRDPASPVRDHAIPIIALTAHAMCGDREACLAAGMDDHLSKPLSAESLTEKLHTWLCDPPHRSVRPVVEAAVSEPEGPPVFDRAAFVKRLMGDEGLSQRVLDSFLDDLPKKIRMLQTAYNDGDLAIVKRHAHTIKGASANVAAEALRHLAAAIERAADHGDGNLALLLDRLEPEFERLQATLRAGRAIAAPD